MFSELRQQEIYTIIREQKKIKVAKLAEIFGVTLETIRNDLKQLEAEGLIERCYGGATLARQEIKKVSQFSDDFNASFLMKDLLLRSYDKKNKSLSKGKLCVLGSFVIDIVAHVEHFPLEGELVESSNNLLSPGGKGTNQAHAASAAQTKVHLITKVGNDSFNKYAYKHVKETGIDSFTIFQSSEEPTGSSVIYLAKETRTNLTATYLGANKTLSEKEVDTVLPYISDSDVLLLQGEVNIDANKYAAEFAKRINNVIILNAAPFNPELKSLYDYLDYILLNAHQASKWSDIKVTDTVSAKIATQKISGIDKKKVITILPDLSVVYFDGKQIYQSEPLPSLKQDLMGGCDAFCGAFSAAISKGESLYQAVAFASAFVASFIEIKGVTSMPSMGMVVSRMEQSKQKQQQSIVKQGLNYE